MHSNRYGNAVAFQYRNVEFDPSSKHCIKPKSDNYFAKHRIVCVKVTDRPILDLR